MLCCVMLCYVMCYIEAKKCDDSVDNKGWAVGAHIYIYIYKIYIVFKGADSLPIYPTVKKLWLPHQEIRIGICIANVTRNQF
jgi:hypothetical protein